MYYPILLTVSGKSYQLESEKGINWFLVLILACLNSSDTGASFILVYYFNTSLSLPLMYLNRCTNTSKCNLPGFDENFANLCTEKLKSALV